MNQKELFSILPDNFFSVLSSEHHKAYADCIFLMFHFLGKGNSFGAYKEEIMDVLINYYESQSNEDETSSKEKAYQTLKRLKQCGWIFEEDEADYQVLINFTYYSIPIIKTLIELKRSDELEYLGYIYLIYSAVKNIEEDNLSDLIDQIHHNITIVMNKLKTLNANIKRYIQELLNQKNQSDLRSIMENLFIDYKKNIIDERYHRLKTSDNVSKYRPFIISKLNLLCLNEELITKVGLKLVEQHKFETVEVAKKDLHIKIKEIIEHLENMDLIIEEIDKKNAKYIQMSISKIMFMVNHSKNLQNKINHILSYSVQKGKKMVSIQTIFNLYQTRYMNKQSLYTMPKKSTLTPMKVVEHSFLSIEERAHRFEELMSHHYYSKKNINEYILGELKESKRMNASELTIDNDMDFIRLILIYMYSSSQNMNYRIKKLHQSIKIKKYQFRDFEIIRK